MRQKIKILTLVLIDLAIVNFSIITAFLLRYDFTIPDKWFHNLPILLVCASFIKLFVFIFSKMYKSLWRYAGTREFLMIAFFIFVSNIMLIGVNICCRLFIPINVYFVIFIFDVIFISSVRVSYRIIRTITNEQKKLKEQGKRILVFGGGELGAHVINELHQQPGLFCLPVAIIDDDENKHGKKIRGVPIVTGIHGINDVIEGYRIDEVIIAIANLDKEVINNIYREGKKAGCKIRVIPGISQIMNEKPSIRKIRELNIEDLLGRETIDVVDDNVMGLISNRVVMVTGGGGSIGSELCRQIAECKPLKLIILDNYENNAYDLKNELVRNYPEVNALVVIANIRESASLKRIFNKQRPDIVFHAAAHKHVPLMEANPLEAIKNNIFGTRNVAEVASLFGVKKFVLISTDKAVNPTNIMGATKRTAEMIIQGMNHRSKTEFVAVRFGNVLGSNGSVIPLFLNQIKVGGPVTVTHKEVTRFFMTIKEAVQLVLQAGSMAKSGEILVLDMGKPMKIYDLARRVIELSGFVPDQDIKIKITGLRPGEKLYEELLLEEEGLTKTESNKIYIAKPTVINYLVLIKDLSTLENIVRDQPEKVLDFMTYLVPTYKKTPNEEKTVMVKGKDGSAKRDNSNLAKSKIVKQSDSPAYVN